MNKADKSLRLLFLPLIVISGTAALIYQICWLRDFRLIYGTSTAANAAVISVFMGGLGTGGILFGRVVDRSARPVRIYALLEIGIALTAFLTPFLSDLARQHYIALGGMTTLGNVSATCVLLLFSFAIMGPPTILMGGTLPALTATFETRKDPGRGMTGLVYALNTFGGVLGIVAATFFLLEMFGNRQTLWLAVGMNIVVGAIILLALHLKPDFLKRPYDRVASSPVTLEPDNKTTTFAENHPYFIYFAAFLVGFVYFLMEIVWYRMLGPLLGGTTYTFGLILSIALAGIGAGSLYYRKWANQRLPSFAFLFLTCAMEALLLAFPLWLGDNVAILAAALQSLSIFGFSGQVGGWVVICLIVVLPASLVAGFQFPLLIGLLGRGRDKVGIHTGSVYAWNTAGAILGSLAGGFGFIPLFSLTGCWKIMVLVLVALGLLTALAHIKVVKKQPVTLASALLISCLAPLSLAVQGPTAVWLHAPLGAGQVQLAGMNTNDLTDWLNSNRRRIIWQQDGVESNIAISGADALSLIVNGKSDGNARYDAGTQIMAPLIGAILHPRPQKALVIGLGTGSSAGWLGKVDSIHRVDTVELEPAVLEMARRAADVNQNVLNNEKIRIHIGDGREYLLTSDEQYDLVFSEPSNPYRAGVSSLFTVEFYRAVAAKLTADGLFSQWVQAYQIDARTVKIIYNTLSAVFPYIDIWTTDVGDLVFVCSYRSQSYATDRLRKRLATEPFHTALQSAWGVTGLEGFLSGFVADHRAEDVMKSGIHGKNMINTDNRMLTEFSFARTLGQAGLFSVDSLKQAMRLKGYHRLEVAHGKIDWKHVDSSYVSRDIGWNDNKIEITGLSEADIIRYNILSLFSNGNFNAIRQAVAEGLWETATPFEEVVLAYVLADAGDDKSIPLAEKIRQRWPGMAEAIIARYQWRSNSFSDAMHALEKAFFSFRSNPWQNRSLVVHTLTLAAELARQNQNFAISLEKSLQHPFSVLLLDEYRKFTLLQVSKAINPEHGADAVALWEPHIPWNENFLRYRFQVYADTGKTDVYKAEKDLRIFLQNKKEQPIIVK